MGKFLIMIFLYFFLAVSCIQNPEAEIQNQRIKDLLEKNDYLNVKINEQNSKIIELNSELKKIEDRIDLLEKRPTKFSYKKRNTLPDSININVKMQKAAN